MYHQFKELAGVDITQEAMEVGPTCHYMMGGVRVNPETQMSSVEGLFAAGECAAGLHGANRLGGNSLSDLLVFGKRAGQFAAEFSKSAAAPGDPLQQIYAAMQAADERFSREDNGDNAFRVQHDLQSKMHALVGIVRTGPEMKEALGVIENLRERAKVVPVSGNRDYNPGWHTALDVMNLLTISEALTRSALHRKESRGGHFREDFPNKDPEASKFNTIIRKGPNGEMQIADEPLVAMTSDQKLVIEEMG
jgi:succinate dehydrogenase / fumarate reductase flavoprotein subunit